jgi:SMI1 / KNR4 family (SUKH-1)
MPFPVDISSVKAAESKLGVAFPLGFVARMLKRNGGEVKAGGDVWELHPFLDKSDRTRLKRTCNDIVLETRNARTRPGFPVDGVAIGSNGSGDALILLADPLAPNKLQARVFWWDHETDNVTAVADDFSDLASPPNLRHTTGESERRRPTKS